MDWHAIKINQLIDHGRIKELKERKLEAKIKSLKNWKRKSLIRENISIS